MEKTMGTIWIVGAGPGADDLITVRGRSLLTQAGAILYAGSLVSQAHLRHAPADCVIADSSSMTLEEMVQWLLQQAARTATVVRLQTGDPSLYGALSEMTHPLLQAGVTVKSVPGVPSFAASAAVALESLTLPEVSQTVILTRVEGRTPMPAGEQLRDLARHGATLCIHLSITLWPKICAELAAAGWSHDTPVLVVHKAEWPGEEKIVRGTLADIAQRCEAAQIGSQSMIIIGHTLNTGHTLPPIRSQLYHPAFGHRCRAASLSGDSENA
ncbi:MAG: precorrin-4 C(11)-methyltransferase [Magnetococcales bacterium]|nr:precorrin-4 C(11)-methyltransferase [Magnetococcales bacterium]